MKKLNCTVDEAMTAILKGQNPMRLGAALSHPENTVVSGHVIRTALEALAGEEAESNCDHNQNIHKMIRCEVCKDCGEVLSVNI